MIFKKIIFCNGICLCGRVSDVQGALCALRNEMSGREIECSNECERNPERSGLASVSGRAGCGRKETPGVKRKKKLANFMIFIKSFSGIPIMK